MTYRNGKLAPAVADRRPGELTRTLVRRGDRIVVLVPVLFLLTLLVAFFMTLGEVAQGFSMPVELGHEQGGKESYLNYTTVQGFFVQSEEGSSPDNFNYTTSNLGLINRTYSTDAEFDQNHEKTQWERFEYYVKHLNRKSPRNVQYKVIIMGRHGEGFHNVAEAFYGTPLWDCYWSLLDGNETTSWADARLTQTGSGQALIANRFWQTALSSAGIPAPERYYVSPLTRCLDTARLTFSGLESALPAERPFRPVVKELLREAIGLHTCDRRSSATYIRDTFPGFRLERGFAEDDPLFSDTLRETNSAQVARMRTLLDDVFTEHIRHPSPHAKRHDGEDEDEEEEEKGGHHDDSGVMNDSSGRGGRDRGATFISFTSHSGAIGCILQAIRHRKWQLKTGGVIPVFVRAERIRGPAPSSTIEPSTSAPTCTADPTATVTTEGAVTTTTATTATPAP